MNVNKCKELLREKKYDKLLETFHEDFIELYKKMLKYSNFEEPENETLIAYGTAVIKCYPKYKNKVIRVENAFYSGEYSYGDSIDILLDSFNYLSKDYKK